ncbi:MAG: hypothetical protein ABIQ16_18465 [Polyangiaceae bacterium]
MTISMDGKGIGQYWNALRLAEAASAPSAGQPLSGQSPTTGDRGAAE